MNQQEMIVALSNLPVGVMKNATMQVERIQAAKVILDLMDEADKKRRTGMSPGGMERPRFELTIYAFRHGASEPATKVNLTLEEPQATDVADWIMDAAKKRLKKELSRTD